MRIVIHCGSGGPDYPWGPDSIGQGIGGSEEAVIYLSRELAALGHEVFVFNRHRVGDAPHVDVNNVWWMPDWYQNVLHEDIFIAWRDWHFHEKSSAGAKKYLWCHDQPVEPHWNTEAAKHFDRIILLNEHHARQYEAAGCPREIMFVCNNGVDLAQFDQQVERIPGKCLYFSHPHRGLHRLRDIYWPRIKAAVPHATLHAFWWQEEFLLPPNEALGIMPMRSLGHMELAREILSSDLLTYPSVFDPEINPITCIKSQVGGAWPVTVNKGGMSNTLLPYGSPVVESDFVDAVIAALNPNHTTLYLGPTIWTDYDTKNESRDKMMADARIVFDWRQIASRWSEEFEKELAK